MLRAQKYLKSKYEKLAREITIIGLGGTGSQVALMLSRLGCKLTLIDRDVVEPSNLDRQYLYSTKDIGKNKAQVAGSALSCEYKDIDICHQNISFKADLVIDCTDSVQTRLLINDYCKSHNIPLISCAAVGELGSAMLIAGNLPCYQCVFGEKHGETCNQIGVLPTATVMAATLTVQITIDYLTRGKLTAGLVRFDTSKYEITTLKTAKNPDCDACKRRYKYLEGKRSLEKLCNGEYALSLGRAIDIRMLSKRTPGELGEFTFKSKDMTVYANGRIIVKAHSPTNARQKIDKFFGI